MIAEHRELVSLLQQHLGIAAELQTSWQVREAVVQYQAIHGLTEHGELDRATQWQLRRPRFCSVPDRLQMGNVRCRWDGTERPLKITYQVRGDFPGLSRTQIQQAFALAWLWWSEVCGIIASPDDQPQVTIAAGRIDGPSGTLAWSELPCGIDKVLQQKYDTGEPWVVAENPAPGKIDLARVACHEIGHVIGLEHGPDGNLLAPYYDPKIRRPQEWDIREAQIRYGQPAGPSPPPTTPEQIAKVTVRVGGKQGTADVPLA